MRTFRITFPAAGLAAVHARRAGFVNAAASGGGGLALGFALRRTFPLAERLARNGQTPRTLEPAVLALALPLGLALADDVGVVLLFALFVVLLFLAVLGVLVLLTVVLFVLDVVFLEVLIVVVLQVLVGVDRLLLVRLFLVAILSVAIILDVRGEAALGTVLAAAPAATVRRPSRTLTL